MMVLGTNFSRSSGSLDTGYESMNDGTLSMKDVRGMSHQIIKNLDDDAEARAERGGIFVARLAATVSYVD